MDTELIWDFMNSTFASWFFPTIIIGFIIWSYKLWKQNDEKKNDLRSRIEELDIEISFRLSRIPTIFFGNLISRNKSYVTNKSNFLRDYLEFNKQNYIYYKFKDESTSGLMIRLSSLVETEDKRAIKKAALRIIDFKQVYLNNHEKIDSKFEENVCKSLSDEVFLNRWDWDKIDD